MSANSYRPDRDDTDVMGARIGAQIVDSIVTGVLFYIPVLLFSIVGGAAGDGGALAGMGIGFLLGFVVAMGYHFLIEGLWDGYTVGKRVFGIRVLKEDGTTPDIGAAVIRNLLEIVDGFFYYAVGLFFMASSDMRQRLGDRIAGTVVVRESSIPDGVTASQDSGARAA